MRMCMGLVAMASATLAAPLQGATWPTYPCRCFPAYARAQASWAGQSNFKSATEQTAKRIDEAFKTALRPFAAGINGSGVCAHMIDWGDGHSADAPWLGCNDADESDVSLCPPWTELHSTSCSAINALWPFVWEDGESPVGWIIAPHMQHACAFPGDGNTRLPGNRCNDPAAQKSIGAALEQQFDRGVPLHNEVIFSGETFLLGLPSAIDAFFVVDCTKYLPLVLKTGRLIVGRLHRGICEHQMPFEEMVEAAHGLQQLYLRAFPSMRPPPILSYTGSSFEEVPVLGAAVLGKCETQKKKRQQRAALESVFRRIRGTRANVSQHELDHQLREKKGHRRMNDRALEPLDSPTPALSTTDLAGMSRLSRRADAAMPFAGTLWNCASSLTITHAAICSGETQQLWAGEEPERVSQRTFSNWADTRPDELWDYLDELYGLDTGCDVDTAQLTFYWHHVPRRSDVVVSWLCTTCVGYMAQGALWAPMQDAAYSPNILARMGSVTTCPPAEHPLSSAEARCHAPCPCEKGLLKASFDSTLLVFPGFFVHRDVNPTPEAGVPDQTWVEVVRIARIDEKKEGPTAAATVGQVWFWLAHGSGIWWNTGRSLVVTDGKDNPGCARAASDGYDSIQITRSFGGFSYEILDCRGSLLRLSTAEETWTAACPPTHVPLRKGLPEPRTAPALAALAGTNQSEPCRCDPAALDEWLHCR